MKALILAGGFGTRISEESDQKPKPMIEIGGQPILWHIMKHYSHHNINEFIILLGYRGYYIKEYFSNYFLHQSNVTIDLSSNSMEIHQNYSEPWKVTLLDTGLNTMTGGRVKRAKDYIDGDTFLLTYGDGVSDVNVSETIKFHRKHEKKITMSSIQPEGRFGALDMGKDNTVNSFMEKPKGDGSWVNGGFFVCNASVLDQIKDDATVFEREPLESMAKEGELISFKHHGFWKCMDTLRDKTQLNDMWDQGNAPWKTWK